MLVNVQEKTKMCGKKEVLWPKLSISHIQSERDKTGWLVIAFATGLPARALCQCQAAYTVHTLIADLPGLDGL